jgi:hypothetical protein
MFLISTKQLAPAGAPDGRAQEFVVLGATGNGKQGWCGLLGFSLHQRLVSA